jgi:peptide deformylase
MELIKYPDPRLSLRNEAIKEYTAEVGMKVAEMIPIMKEKDGVGLAAPQVGWNVRLFVGYVDEGKEASSIRVYFNPRIELGGDTESAEEGCLSFPGIRPKIPRATEVTIRADTPTGPVVETIRHPLYARMIQHEMDHLDGLLLIERMNPAERARFKSQIKALEAEFKGRR